MWKLGKGSSFYVILFFFPFLVYFLFWRGKKYLCCAFSTHEEEEDDEKMQDLDRSLFGEEIDHGAETHKRMMLRKNHGGLMTIFDIFDAIFHTHNFRTAICMTFWIGYQPLADGDLVENLKWYANSLLETRFDLRLDVDEMAFLHGDSHLVIKYETLILEERVSLFNWVANNEHAFGRKDRINDEKIVYRNFAYNHLLEQYVNRKELLKNLFVFLLALTPNDDHYYHLKCKMMGAIECIIVESAFYEAASGSEKLFRYQWSANPENFINGYFKATRTIACCRESIAGVNELLQTFPSVDLRISNAEDIIQMNNTVRLVDYRTALILANHLCQIPGFNNSNEQVQVPSLSPSTTGVPGSHPTVFLSPLSTAPSFPAQSNACLVDSSILYSNGVQALFHPGLGLGKLTKILGLEKALHMIRQPGVSKLIVACRENLCEKLIVFWSEKNRF